MNGILCQQKWFVLYTRPKQERVVLQNLEQKGVLAFLPQYFAMRQWSDRRKKVLMPLFPGYIFVKSPGIDFSLTKVVGAIKYIFFAGKPATLTDREIGLIQKSLNHEPTETNRDFDIPGQRVKVMRGAFEGETGIFVRKEGSTRLYIEIESLSKYLSVSLPAEHLVRI